MYTCPRCERHVIIPAHYAGITRCPCGWSGSAFDGKRENPWDKISELKHSLDRMTTYQTDSISRMKISVDTLKEMKEMLETIILEMRDE